MVATRQHPRGDFSTTESSPTKRPARSRTSTESPAPPSPDAEATELSVSAPQRLARRIVSNTVAAVAPPSSSEMQEPGWCHSVSNVTVAWLSVSMPLVFWDTLYILLRPHTMKGGALQWPLWKPYEIYAAIDHVYGQPGWDNKDGFGGAQGVLNAVELVLYGLYALVVYHHSLPAPAGTGIQARKGVGAWLSGGRKMRGPSGNRALLLGFAAAVMTLSKTVLYYFNEYFSGFANVGHNDWPTLLWFYVVMNGLWIAFPAYMTIVFGSDILKALDIASSEPTCAKAE